jgi:hypothetical protein
MSKPFRTAHVKTDEDLGWALCGEPRRTGWEGIMVPASSFGAGQLPANDTAMLCEKCLNHPDLPLLLLGDV